MVSEKHDIISKMVDTDPHLDVTVRHLDQAPAGTAHFREDLGFFQ